MISRRRSALVFAVVVSLAPLAAHGQEAEPEGTVERRPVPDYGRAPEPEEPAEALLWIPRILFLPLHVVLEYLVRLPLDWLLRAIELERLDAILRPAEMPQLARPEARWTFLPRARYDYGLQPSAGLGFRVHDASERLHLRVGFAFWGKEQVSGDVRASARFGPTSAALDVLGSYRSDGIFHGLGWSSPPSPRARYAEARGGGGVSFTGRPWRRTAITSGVRAAVHRFDDTPFHQDDDVSIDQAIASGAIVAPPGYPEGYTALETWLRVVLDTRRENEWPHASGLRAELVGAWAIDLERGVDASWARAHGEVELALEVMRDRAVSLRSVVAIAESLGPLAVPFTEQVWLGGELSRMPGFLPGRLIGESAVTLGLAWRYAIWAWIDAALFVDVGNVFGSLFDDLELERLRLSFGTALMAHDEDDFAILLAFGTEPFVLGADLSSVRFAISFGMPP